MSRSQVDNDLPRQKPYRGRLAPSPTGLLHLGHARTFWIAQERARAQSGTLVLRTEDLDRERSRGEFVKAMFEDLRWFGFQWQEGPDCGGPHGPYTQSERQTYYLSAFEKLRRGGFIYPCVCSRQDVLRALQAPHATDEEPIYPGTCRPKAGDSSSEALSLRQNINFTEPDSPGKRPRINWRFRVPDDEPIGFVDLRSGAQRYVAGRDFGDFIVWRHDNMPSYHLAVVVDDASMQITEVVRGEDLLLSTARQALLYRALELEPPAYYHCALMTDTAGNRLAKRHDSLSLRALRASGVEPDELRRTWWDKDKAETPPG